MTNEGQEVPKEKSKLSSLLSKAKVTRLLFLTPLFSKLKVVGSGIRNMYTDFFILMKKYGAVLFGKMKTVSSILMTYLSHAMKTVWSWILKNGESLRSKAKGLRWRYWTQIVLICVGILIFAPVLKKLRMVCQSKSPDWLTILVVVIAIVTFVVATCVFVKSRIRKWREVENKPESVTWSPGAWLKDNVFSRIGAFVPNVLMLGALAITLFWVIGKIGTTRPSSAEAGRSEMISIQAPIVVQPKAKQHGTITWWKPDGVEGRNPLKRSDSLDVVVNRNDASIMELTVNYRTEDGSEEKAELLGVKREDGMIEGSWSQKNPSGSGTWTLKPDEGDARVYRGELWNGEGIPIPMKLEI